ncbi:hypothetical protein ABIS04_07485 [Shewanella sp. H8]|uniref:DUF6942 family protein n=1 Tax=Shewanella sp. H8 TaxID=3342676 RepID=UPI003314AAE8
MSSDLFSHVWGPMNPEIIFYLPTPPELPTHWQAYHPDSITQLITLNGNHWRKIVTIMAKICCLEHDMNANKGISWKQIRDQLFNEPYDQKTDKPINTPSHLHCQLCIVKPNVNQSEEVVFRPESWHILCGKEVQQRMGITEPRLYTSLDAKQKIRHQHTVLLTPYLDYRQYSNALIELTRQHIATEKCYSINRK